MILADKNLQEDCGDHEARGAVCGSLCPSRKQCLLFRKIHSHLSFHQSVNHQGKHQDHPKGLYTLTLLEEEVVDYHRILEKYKVAFYSVLTFVGLQQTMAVQLVFFHIGTDGKTSRSFLQLL